MTTATRNGSLPKDARSAAELYLAKGLAPIPLPPRSKDPGYADWRSLRVRPDTLDEHFPSGERRNVGVLNGSASGNLVDADLDCAEARLAAPELLPPTGWAFGRASAPRSHWVYRTDRQLEAAQVPFTDPDGAMLLELRGSGGLTVFPPSTHKESGEVIAWDLFSEPGEVRLDELQRAARELAACALLARRWPTRGSRDEAAMALSGALARAKWVEEKVSRFVGAVALAAGDEEACMRAGKGERSARRLEAGENITGWPRLTQLLGADGKSVVRRVRQWLGLAAPRSKGAGRPSAASRLVSLVQGAGVQLFHAGDERTFAHVPSAGHRETWPLRSSRFRTWLSRLFYQAQKKAPGGQALSDALNVMEGQALHDGPSVATHLRVAGHEGRLYLDLADPEWRAVEIDAAGWRVVADPPVRFRRPKGMLPLPEPARGGSLDQLRPLVNVRGEADWLLLVGWLAGALRDRGPYPVLALAGEQGTAKSTLGRFTRRLLDPSVTLLRSDPRDARDLMIAAHNGWLVGYDNLSDVPSWLSDALCRLATGGGFGTRQLYSDEEETIFDAVRPALLTSVTDVVTAPDLLDRCLFLRLAPIGERQRLTEEELEARFLAAWPRVLGGLCDSVSAGLRLRPGVRPDRLPRMADFALFAEAVCRGLGHPPGAFLEALEANRQDADEVALEAFLIVPALRRLLDEEGEFVGTATELLERLNGLAEDQTRRQRGWPSRPNHLSGQLRRLAPNLRRSGVSVDLNRAHGGARQVRLCNTRREDRPDSSSSSSPSSPIRLETGAGDDGDDQDDHLHHSSSPVEGRESSSPGLSTCALDGTGDDGDDQDDESQVSSSPVEGREPSSPTHSLQGRPASGGFGTEEQGRRLSSPSSPEPSTGGLGDDGDDQVDHLHGSSSPEERRGPSSPLDLHRGHLASGDDGDDQDDGLHTCSCLGNCQTASSPTRVCPPSDNNGEEQRCKSSSPSSPSSPASGRSGGAYRLVNDPAGLEEVVSAINRAEVVGLDLETTGLDPHRDRARLLSLALDARDGGTSVYLLDLFRLDAAPVIEALRKKELVAHNALFDLAFLGRLGHTPEAPVRCTMTLSRLLHAGERTGHGLKDCLQRELSVAVVKEMQKADWSGALATAHLDYAAQDVLHLRPLLDALSKKIGEAGLGRAAEIEVRCMPAVAWMASSGVAVDRAAWLALVDAAEQETARLKGEMAELAPVRPGEMFAAWNWDSPADMKALFAALGLEVEDTGDATLARLGHPLAGMLRAYREATKRTGTYGRAWTKHIAADGRVYPRWNQTGSEAGRMSCSDPNMQQLPRDKAYRRCVVAPPGRVLVKADYSQIELRIAAKVSGDPALLDAYAKGADVHTQTAQRVLGKRDVSKEDRQLAKALNFGLLYGMGRDRFRENARAEYGLDLSEQQAERYRDAFFRAYPGLRAWHRAVGSTGDTAIDTRTLAGRRRLGVARFTEKLNTPVQGTGADGLKLALALLWERREQCPGAFLVMAVHDEIVLEADEAKAGAAARWLKAAMVDAMAPLIDPVPVEVEVKVGRTWAGG